MVEIDEKERNLLLKTPNHHLTILRDLVHICADDGGKSVVFVGRISSRSILIASVRTAETHDHLAIQTE